MRHEEECCPNMVHDPLFTEMALTLPVDFHSFRRAFVSAGAAGGVNVQTMMRVAHHSYEKRHMGYAAKNSPEMRRIPNAAVPDLPLGLFTVSLSPKPSDLTRARHRGFEPLTFGFGGDRGALSTRSKRSQASRTVRVEQPGSVHSSQPVARNHKQFAASLLQGAAIDGTALRVIDGGKDRLLSVRQVATRLGVCTATVYLLCERNELAHVRVLNAIRIAPADLAEFIDTRRKPQAP